MRTFDTCIINDVHVIAPERHLVGGDETEDLKAAVAEVAAAGTPRVVVDLSKVSWVSSLGLCGLIRAQISCDDHQGG
jgi:anti-anti-sigma regulatory factor